MDEDDLKISSQDLNRLLVIMLSITVVMCLVSAYAWWRLPADVRIPVHWGIDGNADRFGGKAEGLLLFPGIVLVVAVVFRLIPLIEPRRRNLLRSFVAYRMVALSVAAFFLVLHSTMIANLLGITRLGLTPVVGLLVSALVMVLGNYLGKVRSNFMFGVRTPWTLTSNIAWDKTHRLAGRLFFITGLAGIILNASLPVIGLRVFIAVLVADSLFVVVYSWLVWRTAPDRQTR